MSSELAGRYLTRIDHIHQLKSQVDRKPRALIAPSAAVFTVSGTAVPVVLRVTVDLKGETPMVD